MLDTAAGAPAAPLDKEGLKKRDSIRVTHHVGKASRETVLRTSSGGTCDFVTDIESSPCLATSDGAKTVLILVNTMGGGGENAS